MRAVEDVAALRAALAPHRRSGARIGFVPTMGALHAGHLSLVRAAVDDCDVAVVSIFVNPLQFGPGEDYTTYPRDLDGDLAQLDGVGVAFAFTPTTAVFLPRDMATSVRVSGPLAERLEGASRRGHFDGVATIVVKLLSVVGPHAAYFGEKDYQQLAVVRRVVRDLELPVRVVGSPTVREPDGLALSSRNAYLSEDDRRAAAALSAALRAAQASWDGDATAARARLATRLAHAPGVRLDYAEVADPETLEPLEGVVAGPAQALVAAHVGPTRLIDNIRLEPAAGPGGAAGPTR